MELEKGGGDVFSLLIIGGKGRKKKKPAPHCPKKSIGPDFNCKRTLGGGGDCF